MLGGFDLKKISKDTRMLSLACMLSWISELCFFVTFIINNHGLLIFITLHFSN